MKMFRKKQKKGREKEKCKETNMSKGQKDKGASVKDLCFNVQ